MSKKFKYVYFILGILSLVLGIIGAFLPILPTTPLIILASYLFSKSSPKLQSWLLSNKRFGPMIRDWHEHGTISKKAKAYSISMIIFFISISLFYNMFYSNFYYQNILSIILVLIAFSVVIFIYSRPSSVDD